MSPNFFEHLLMDFQMAPLGQEVERLAVVQVVVKLAVRSEAWERPASDEATLPQPAQAPVGNILIAPGESHYLRGRTEPVAQNGVEDIEVAVGDLASPCVLRADEFRKAGHRRMLNNG
ncbi:MAG: hypothetical protein ABSF25_16215 [Bryobacteraceae bacterium]